MSLSLLVSVHSGDCEVLAIGAAGRRHRSQPHRSTQDTSSAEPRRLCRSGVKSHARPLTLRHRSEAADRGESEIPHGTGIWNELNIYLKK